MTLTVHASFRYQVAASSAAECRRVKSSLIYRETLLTVFSTENFGEHQLQLAARHPAVVGGHRVLKNVNANRLLCKNHFTSHASGPSRELVTFARPPLPASQSIGVAIVRSRNRSRHSHVQSKRGPARACRRCVRRRTGVRNRRARRAIHVTGDSHRTSALAKSRRPETWSLLPGATRWFGRVLKLQGDENTGNAWLRSQKEILLQDLLRRGLRRIPSYARCQEPRVRYVQKTSARFWLSRRFTPKTVRKVPVAGYGGLHAPHVFFLWNYQALFWYDRRSKANSM
jgi:hypothetical protein